VHQVVELHGRKSQELGDLCLSGLVARVSAYELPVEPHLDAVLGSLALRRRPCDASCGPELDYAPFAVVDVRELVPESVVDGQSELSVDVLRSLQVVFRPHRAADVGLHSIARNVAAFIWRQKLRDLRFLVDLGDYSSSDSILVRHERNLSRLRLGCLDDDDTIVHELGPWDLADFSAQGQASAGGVLALETLHDGCEDRRHPRIMVVVVMCPELCPASEDPQLMPVDAHAHVVGGITGDALRAARGARGSTR
jgi:hypothetical protein